jgi:hypothetical protein
VGRDAVMRISTSGTVRRVLDKPLEIRLMRLKVVENGELKDPFPW